MRCWICLFMLTLRLQAALLHVPADHATIQAAIDVAADGDTVHVAPGTYNGLLTIPDRNLSLVSDDFFTGDSLAIDSTILDGQWQGSLITVQTRGDRVFRLEGVTLKKGKGSETQPYRGGAIYLRDSSNATIRHVVFRENRGPHAGALLRSDSGLRLGRIVLEDIRGHLYRRQQDPETSNDMIHLLGAESVVCSKLRFLPSEYPSDVIAIGADSVIVHDVVVSSQHSIGTCIEIGAFICDIDSVFVSDCHSQENTVLMINTALGEQSVLAVSHLMVDRCTNEKRYEVSSLGLIVDLSSDTLRVDHMSVTNCYGASDKLVRINAAAWGTVRHLLVEDNECGSPSQGEESMCQLNCSGHIVDSERCSFEDVLIQRNLSHVYPMTWSGQPQVRSYGYGLALNTTAGLRRNIEDNFYRRMIIQNNVVHDHDDYDNPNSLREANRGRAFYLWVDNTQIRKQVLIEDCILRGNRQINTIPESFSGDPVLDGFCVGSTLEVYGGHYSFRPPKIWLRNVLVEDNDDGGIFLYGGSSYDAQNISVRNTSRMGMLCLADTLVLANVVVEGVESWEAHFTYPYVDDHPTWQGVLTLLGGPASKLSNISLLNNHTEFLFSTYDNTRPQLTLQNSILSGNGCRYFVDPYTDSTDFQPPLFSYCLLPSWYSGDHNLYGQNPLFDAELGPPYLSAESPCVDAGNSAVEWNDPEDSTQPGFPLWPSLGTLRNDMGYTGGPQAAAIDTGWVAVQRPKPQPGRPASFTLGNPYPNPFNPVSLIPYSLDRPRHVRLVVHNLLGQEVAVLVDDIVPAGTHTAQFGTWRLASGTYLVTLETGGRQETRSVTLLR